MRRWSVFGDDARASPSISGLYKSIIALQIVRRFYVGTFPSPRSISKEVLGRRKSRWPCQSCRKGIWLRG